MSSMTHEALAGLAEEYASGPSRILYYDGRRGTVRVWRHVRTDPASGRIVVRYQGARLSTDEIAEVAA